ncbi:MAG: hypothetical protein ACKVIR_06800 [Candidatus Poseidoniales archaeon]
MAGAKGVVSVVLGLLIIGSLIGWSSEELYPGVPKPSAGFCGVTKEAFSDVPGSGAMLDIDVVLNWDDSEVWVGIIDVKTFDKLDKLPGGNANGEIVSCSTDIDYVAGGPSVGNVSTFDWSPDGEDFHIMIGSLDDDDGGGDDGGGDPWPFSGESETMSFAGEFNVIVNSDVSGGWAVILLLILIEIGVIYLNVLDR